MRATTLKNLKPGSSLFLTRKIKKYWNLNAFYDCTHPGGVNTEKDLADYFIRKAVAIDLPYKATLVRYMHDVTGGGRVPGALVQVEVAGLKDSMYLDHNDLSLSKEKA